VYHRGKAAALHHHIPTGGTIWLDPFEAAMAVGTWEIDPDLPSN
jgi:hypothetical protein